MTTRHTDQPRQLVPWVTLLFALSVTPTSWAQPQFSVDFQGPTAAGGAITPGDILAATGLAPAVVVASTALGLVPSNATGQVEVDAISQCSRSLSHPPGDKLPQLFIEFTVDEFAAGITTSPLAPNVTSEGATGWREASADIYSLLTATLPPIPSPVFGNSGVWDGNGLFPFGGPGLGLVERNPPRVGLPDRGDNVDGLLYPNTNSTWTFLSLDAGWVDPIEGWPANSGTAAANGFAPGDVLAYVPGATPAVRLYASYQQLGLGPLDDIDALVVHEGGNGVFDPTSGPYEWDIPPTYYDMVLFSVRRGSPIIGTLDSFRGLPIEEGDILTVMNFGTTVPGILAPAEALGLRTARGGYTLPSGYADDLDGMAIPPMGRPSPFCDPPAEP